MLAEQARMAAHRGAMRKYGGGPGHVIARIAEYLRAEQGLGRIGADADLEPWRCYSTVAASTSFSALLQRWAGCGSDLGLGGGADGSQPFSRTVTKVADGSP
ncbi:MULTISPECIES: hypothetical protein [unclassified Nocardia]|uniref:hypothetical protein n=1 Tax=unclassified Nocardia TaxID=2637762 RepID=UPI001CE4867E|nr:MULTISPECIES: hypothetical protein [unclassified Nocardia]